MNKFSRNQNVKFKDAYGKWCYAIYQHPSDMPNFECALIPGGHDLVIHNSLLFPVEETGDIGTRKDISSTPPQARHGHVGQKQ